MLFCVFLEGKNAKQWYELNQTPTPNPPSITVFEDSTLDLTIDSAFIKNQNNSGAYTGDVILPNSHNLFITANILAVDNAQGSALQTTIYKNFNPNSTITISGDGAMSLSIKGDKQAKSLFDVDNGGNMVIDTWLSVNIQNNQTLFSIFRAGQGSTMSFQRALSVDVSGAIGGLTPSGSIGVLKPIFDISQGSVYINPNLKNNDIILKGDIFSTGVLEANFITSNSLLNGKVALRDGSKTTLRFDKKATGDTELNLANQSTLSVSVDNGSNLSGKVILRDTSSADIGFNHQAVGKIDFSVVNQSIFSISLDNQSRIDGILRAVESAKSKIVIKNKALLSVDASFDGNTQSQSEILGGEWEGRIGMAGNGSHQMSLADLGTFIGDIYILSNAKLTLDSTNSKISGSITANGNGSLKATMNRNNVGEFKLTLNQNAQASFSLSNSSRYQGEIVLNGNSQSTILVESNASFDSKITLSDTPNFSLQMRGGSVSKAIVELALNSAPTKSEILLDNATFLGSILQPQTNYAYMKISNNATWYIQANSQVNTLSFENGGSVDFTSSNFDIAQKRGLNAINSSNRLIFKADTISGNGGEFNLYGILNRNAWGRDSLGGVIATDKIITSTLIGTHSIKIFWDLNQLDTSLLSANLYDDHIVVAEQSSSNGGGNFVGAQSDLGVYQYDTKLTRIEKRDASGNLIGYEWILGEYIEPKPPIEPPIEPPINPEPPIDPPPPIDPEPNPTPNPQPPAPSMPELKLSDSARLINTLLSSQYKIWHFQVENLHTRLGDLRNILTSSNVWAKVKYGVMLGEEGEELISSKQMNTMLSFGADYSFYTSYGRNFVGGGLDVSFYQDYGDERNSRVYEGESTTFGVSVYDTFLFHNGIYIDSVLKYYYSNNQFSIGLDELKSNSPSFSHHGLIASLEIGKKFRLPIPTPDFSRSFYYLKPEIGISVGYLMGESVDFSHLGGYVLASTLSSSTPIQTRVGIDFGRRFDNDRVLGDVFVTLGSEYTALSKGDVKIATPINAVNLKSKGLYNLRLGVGGNVIFDDRVRMYFDANSRFLGYIQPVLNMNVGVKIILGERIKNVPKNEIQQNSTPQGAEYIYLN